MWLQKYCFINNTVCDSFFLLLLFLVVTRMLVTGYKRPLEEKDLWSLNLDDRSHKVVPHLVQCWNKECQKVKTSVMNRF